MKNFGKLDFKNYLDSYDDPNVWDAPRLIVQVDSWLNVVFKSDAGLNGGPFELSYGLIVLGERESLISHFDEGTMNNKDVDTWCFSMK
ncbi:MAG: hypothetical protein ACKPKO_08585 [Candidatus Fonsibacter sp.]